jgi:hypothetical protein
VYALPLSEYATRCKHFGSKWEQSEEYREKEVFEEMSNIFIDQIKKVA